jgi:hypothetical protein
MSVRVLSVHVRLLKEARLSYRRLPALLRDIAVQNELSH